MDSLLAMLIFYVAARDARSVRVLIGAALASFACFALLAIAMDVVTRHVGRRPLASRGRPVVDVGRADRAVHVRADRAAAGGLRRRQRLDGRRPRAARAAGRHRADDRQPRRLDRARRRLRAPRRSPLRCAGRRRSRARRCAGSRRSPCCCSCSRSRSPTCSRSAPKSSRPRAASPCRSSATRASCCGSTSSSASRERPLTGYGFGRRILAGPLAAEMGDPLLAHAHNVFASQWLQTGLSACSLHGVHRRARAALPALRALARRHARVRRRRRARADRRVHRQEPDRRFPVPQQREGAVGDDGVPAGLRHAPRADPRGRRRADDSPAQTKHANHGDDGAPRWISAGAAPATATPPPPPRRQSESA